MKKQIIVDEPLEVYEATVNKSGTGAVIYSKKSLIGMKALIIIGGTKQ